MALRSLLSDFENAVAQGVSGAIVHMSCTCGRHSMEITLYQGGISMGYGYFMTSIPPLLYLCIVWWIFRMPSIESIQLYSGFQHIHRFDLVAGW
jgi:hypothetical protein